MHMNVRGTHSICRLLAGQGYCIGTAQKRSDSEDIDASPDLLLLGTHVAYSAEVVHHAVLI